MTKLKLQDAPRLYAKPEVLRRLQQPLQHDYLDGLAKKVVLHANRLCRTAPINESEKASYQLGTRETCNRLEVLTGAWVITQKDKYRNAAIQHLNALTRWNQISCEANPLTPKDTVMMFCLSYGELSAVVGLMYDLFKTTGLTTAEQEAFTSFLDKFLLRAALNCVDSPPWWANKDWSNWNGVCSGGMGILALAVYDDMPQAQKLIPFVEKSLHAYFQSYIANGGGCHEGTGYWNYGMNYAMRYLLSWENATGQKHKALDIPEIGESLYFPLDFTGITFGDNDGWGPCAFYFLLAERLGMKSAAMNAAVYLTKSPNDKRKKHIGADILYAANAIPSIENMEKLRVQHSQRKSPVARVYKGMDWAALADDNAFPSLRMAVRGGSSKISGHGMLDLLSIRCRVNDELIITDQQDGGYMATTFSRRGTELYGRSAASKSTLFVDGLGCNGNVTCKSTDIVKAPNWTGIRIDASSIYLPRWKEVFIGRLVMMVDKAYWLVVDRIQGKNIVDKHWMESRFHTDAHVKAGKNYASLRAGNERVQMTFASWQQGVLKQSTGMPSQPQITPTTIYRWMSDSASHDHLHVAAIVPGNKKAQVEITKSKNKTFNIKVSIPDQKARNIKLTTMLEPA